MKITKLVALGFATTFALTACLNPIGFAPEVKIKIDGNVRIDGGDLDVDSNNLAWLIVRNNTQSVDAERVTVRIPDNDQQFPAGALVSVITQKPKHGCETAFSLKPKTGEYRVIVDYKSIDPAFPGDGTLETTVACPVRGEYILHLWRDAGGRLHLDVNVNNRHPVDWLEDKDLQDKFNVSNNVYVEGSVSVTLDGTNKDRYGLLVIKNLAWDMDVDRVETGYHETPHSSVDQADRYFAILANASGTPPAVKRSDLSSILLGPNSWQVVLHYNSGGDKTVDRSAAINAGREFILFFYKTKSGGYDVSNVWPPVPNNAHDGNKDPNAICGPGDGILRVYNKSSKFIEEIRWDADYLLDAANGRSPIPPGGNFEDIVLPAGTRNLAFRVAGNPDFGREFSFNLVAQKVNEITYTDDFEVDVPPTGGALIRVFNNAHDSYTTVQTIRITKVDDSMQRTFSFGDFDPQGVIGPNGGYAKIKLTNSAELPIVQNVQYYIDVIVSTTEGSFVIRQTDRLYNKTVIFTVDDNTIAVNKQNTWGKVEMANTSDADIVGIDIYDPVKQVTLGVPSYLFSTGTPVVYGQSGVNFTVYNTASFELVQGRNYEFWAVVQRGGGQRTIKKVASTALWRTTVHISLSQADIDALVPPLPPKPGAFVPVTGTTLASSIVATVNQEISLSAANFVPAVATAVTENKPVRWVDIATAGGATYQEGFASGLTNVYIIRPTGTGTITLKARIDDGAARGTPWESNSITITVKPEQVSSVPVSNITGIPAEVFVGVNTDVGAAIYPSGANYNGTPFSGASITWSILNDNAGAVIAQSNPLRLRTASPGTFTLKAVIANGKGSLGSYEQSWTIQSVLSFTKTDPSYVGIRIKYIGNPVSSASWRGTHVSRYFEVVRRPDYAYGGNPIDDRGSYFRDGNIRTGKSAVYWAYDSGATAGQNRNLYAGSCAFSIELPKVSPPEIPGWTDTAQHAKVNTVNSWMAQWGLGNITQPDGTRTHRGFFQPGDGFLNAPMAQPGDAPLEFYLPVKHPSDTTNRKSTVYWLRAGTDQNSCGWGRTWQAWSILEWFAIDIDAVQDKIGRDGFIEIGLKCYDSGNGDHEMSFIAK